MSIPAESFNQVQVTFLPISKQCCAHQQATALAYAEREVVDAALRSCAAASSDLRPVLTQLLTLHALRRLEADLSWLLTEGFLSMEMAKAVSPTIR